VAVDLARQVAAGSRSIAGVLIESHLVEGRQDIALGRRGLVYGQSVTDGCIGWDSTVDVVAQLGAAVRARRGRTTA
jgi:3-deoxy-7-phosphoheptulonate synthase